jgi:hypothetical protein
MPTQRRRKRVPKPMTTDATADREGDHDHVTQAELVT